MQSSGFGTVTRYSSAELRSADPNLLPKDLRPAGAGGGGGGANNGSDAFSSYGTTAGDAQSPSRGGGAASNKKVCPPHRLGLGICEEAVYLFVSAIYSNDVLAQLAATDAAAATATNNTINDINAAAAAKAAATATSIADAPPAIIAFKISPVGDVEVVTTASSSSSSPSAVTTPPRPLYFDSFLEARAFRPFSFFTLYPSLLGAVLLDKLYLLVPDEVELAVELPVEPGTQYYAASTAPTKSRGGHAKATSSKIYNVVTSTWVGVPFRSPASPMPIPDMPKNEKGRLQLFNTGGDHTRYVPMQNGASVSVVSAVGGFSGGSGSVGNSPRPQQGVVAGAASGRTSPPPQQQSAKNDDDFFCVPSTMAMRPQQQQDLAFSETTNGANAGATARPPPSLVGTPPPHSNAAGTSSASPQQQSTAGARRSNPTFFVSFSNSDIVANKTFYFCDDIDIAGDVPFPFGKPTSEGISLAELTDLAVAEAGANAAMAAASKQNPSSKAKDMNDYADLSAPLFDADWNQAMRKPFRLGMMRALEPCIVHAATMQQQSSSSSSLVLSSAMGVASVRVSLRGFAGLLAAAQYCSKLVRGFVSSQTVAVNKVPDQYQRFDTTPVPSAAAPAPQAAAVPTPTAPTPASKLSDEDDFFYGHLEAARSYNGGPIAATAAAAVKSAATAAVSCSSSQSSSKYALSELRHVPSETMGLCVLDRQNNGNPGPRYYGRGLNDSASAAGNDHLVEVLVWQRVDVYASAVVPKPRKAALDPNAPRPPPSIFREPSFVPIEATATAAPPRSSSLAVVVSPAPSPVTSQPKSNADLLDDFFGGSKPPTPTPQQPAAPAVAPQPQPQQPPVVSTQQQQQAAAEGGDEEPIVDAFAGSYYRYSKHTILRGTIPVRWTTTLPNPLSLGSLGHFEAKMLFDQTPSKVSHRQAITSSSGCVASQHQQQRSVGGKPYTRVTDLTADYFATLWAKLGGGNELLEHLPSDVEPHYATRLAKLAASHSGRASVIGADCAAFVPAVAMRRPPPPAAAACATAGSGVAVAMPPSLIGANQTAVSSSSAASSSFKAPRPRIRCVNLLRQKPENGEEDMLSQHFVTGVRRANEVLFGATFPSTQSPQPQLQAIGVAASPMNAKLELVHVDWLRLCKEFDTAEAVGVLWANTIPFLCGGGGAAEGALAARRNSLFFAPDDDGSVTTGVIIPSRLNHGVARGVLASLVTASPVIVASANANAAAKPSSPSSLPLTIRLPIKDAEAHALLSGVTAGSPACVTSVASFADILLSSRDATFTTLHRLGNYSQSPSSYAVTHMQSQFLRINCADSLDRTNLTSYMINQQMTLEMTRRILAMGSSVSYSGIVVASPASPSSLAASGARSLLPTTLAPTLPPSNAVFGSDSDSSDDDEDGGGGSKGPKETKEPKEKKKSVWKMFSNTVVGGGGGGKAVTGKKQQIQQIKAMMSANQPYTTTAVNGGDFLSIAPSAAAPSHPQGGYQSSSNVSPNAVHPDSFASLSSAQLVASPPPVTRAAAVVPPHPSVSLASVATTAMLANSVASAAAAANYATAAAYAPHQLLNLRIVAGQVIGHRDNVISIPSAMVISACDPVAEAVREELVRDGDATIAATLLSRQQQQFGVGIVGAAGSIRKFRAPFASTYEELIEDGVRQVKLIKAQQQQQQQQQQMYSQARSSQFVDVTGDVLGAGVPQQQQQFGGASPPLAAPPAHTSIASASANATVDLASAPTPASIVVPYGLLRALSTIYVACGDAISMSYTNTNALHTNLLRGFTGSKPTSSNAVLSAKRRYENTFQDKKKMRLIDSLLGRNMALHFPLLCSGPYYVCKLPISKWRNAIVIQGVPSWASEADVDAAVRKAWDAFVRSRPSQSLPDGSKLVFKVFTAQRFLHYTPSAASVAELNKHLVGQQQQQQQCAQLSTVAAMMPQSLNPHHVTLPPPPPPSGMALQGLLQGPMGSRLDLGAPKAGARARGASLFISNGGGAELPSRPTPPAACAQSAAEDDFFMVGSTNIKKAKANAEDGFVVVGDAEEAAAAEEEDDAEEEEDRAMDALREATSAVRFDSGLNETPPHSAAGSFAQPQHHHDPFALPSATNPRMSAGQQQGSVPMPRGDDDDGYGLSARELEGLVDGAKHLAVVVFAESEHIQYTNPLLSLGAIEVQRGGGGGVAAAHTQQQQQQNAANVIGSSTNRRSTSSFKAICPLRQYDYAYEGKGTFGPGVSFEQYHGVYPVAPSDPSHYASEQVVKYVPPPQGVPGAPAGAFGASPASTGGELYFAQPQHGGGPQYTSPTASAALAATTITALQAVGNEYPCDVNRRRGGDGSGAYGNDNGDEDGSGLRDAGGGGGGNTLSAATTKAVSSFKNGFRSLVRNF